MLTDICIYERKQTSPPASEEREKRNKQLNLNVVLMKNNNIKNCKYRKKERDEKKMICMYTYKVK
jgi:hypothetical protein